VRQVLKKRYLMRTEKNRRMLSVHDFEIGLQSRLFEGSWKALEY
jgi:hypothetical protein